jgi:hypothetical protein
MACRPSHTEFEWLFAHADFPSFNVDFSARYPIDLLVCDLHVHLSVCWTSEPRSGGLIRIAKDHEGNKVRAVSDRSLCYQLNRQTRRSSWRALYRQR